MLARGYARISLAQLAPVLLAQYGKLVEQLQPPHCTSHQSLSMAVLTGMAE